MSGDALLAMSGTSPLHIDGSIADQAFGDAYNDLYGVHEDLNEENDIVSPLEVTPSPRAHIKSKSQHVGRPSLKKGSQSVKEPKKKYNNKPAKYKSKSRLEKEKKSLKNRTGNIFTPNKAKKGKAKRSTHSKSRSRTNNTATPTKPSSSSTSSDADNGNTNTLRSGSKPPPISTIIKRRKKRPITNRTHTKQYVDRDTPSMMNPTDIVGASPITPMTPPFDNHLGSRSADNSPYTSQKNTPQYGPTEVTSGISEIPTFNIDVTGAPMLTLEGLSDDNDNNDIHHPLSSNSKSPSPDVEIVHLSSKITIPIPIPVPSPITKSQSLIPKSCPIPNNHNKSPTTKYKDIHDSDDGHPEIEPIIDLQATLRNYFNNQDDSDGEHDHDPTTDIAANGWLNLGGNGWESDSVCSDSVLDDEEWRKKHHRARQESLAQTFADAVTIPALQSMQQKVKHYIGAKEKWRPPEYDIQPDHGDILQEKLIHHKRHLDENVNNPTFTVKKKLGPTDIGRAKGFKSPVYKHMYKVSDDESTNVIPHTNHTFLNNDKGWYHKPSKVSSNSNSKRRNGHKKSGQKSSKHNKSRSMALRSKTPRIMKNRVNGKDKGKNNDTRSRNNTFDDNKERDNKLGFDLNTMPRAKTERSADGRDRKYSSNSSRSDKIVSFSGSPKKKGRKNSKKSPRKSKDNHTLPHQRSQSTFSHRGKLKKSKSSNDPNIHKLSKKRTRWKAGE